MGASVRCGLASRESMSAQPCRSATERGQAGPRLIWRQSPPGHTALDNRRGVAADLVFEPHLITSRGRHAYVAEFRKLTLDLPARQFGKRHGSDLTAAAYTDRPG